MTRSVTSDLRRWNPKPDGPTLLKLIKISKIKVRKYGSQYRVDRHENYAERWSQLKLEKELSNLWKVSALADRHTALRIVLFIGFDNADDPFAKELAQLQQSLDWERHGAEYYTRVWQDRYARGFWVKLAGPISSSKDPLRQPGAAPDIPRTSHQKRKRRG